MWFVIRKRAERFAREMSAKTGRTYRVLSGLGVLHNDARISAYYDYHSLQQPYFLLDGCTVYARNGESLKPIEKGANSIRLEY